MSLLASVAVAVVGIAFAAIGVACARSPQTIFRIRMAYLVRERPLNKAGAFIVRATGVFLVAVGTALVLLAVVPEPFGSTLAALAFFGTLVGTALYVTAREDSAGR